MPCRHQLRMIPSEGFRPRSVVAVERPAGMSLVELRAVRRQLRLQVVEDALRQAAGVALGLHHQRRHGADDRRLRHRVVGIAGDVVDHLAAAGGMADVDRAAHPEVLDHRRHVVGVSDPCRDHPRPGWSVRGHGGRGRPRGNLRRGRTASAHPSRRRSAASHDGNRSPGRRAAPSPCRKSRRHPSLSHNPCRFSRSGVDAGTRATTSAGAPCRVESRRRRAASTRKTRPTVARRRPACRVRRPAVKRP
ncbi:Uncharacterised protein [Pseudomonas aeruginosa]|nr:Uncharacterised protein [Pseudomonas aeruginosa]